MYTIKKLFKKTKFLIMLLVLSQLRGDLNFDGCAQRLLLVLVRRSRR